MLPRACGGMEISKRTSVDILLVRKHQQQTVLHLPVVDDAV